MIIFETRFLMGLKLSKKARLVKPGCQLVSVSQWPMYKLHRHAWSVYMGMNSGPHALKARSTFLTELSLSLTSSSVSLYHYQILFSGPDLISLFHSALGCVFSWASISLSLSSVSVHSESLFLASLKSLSTITITLLNSVSWMPSKPVLFGNPWCFLRRSVLTCFLAIACVSQIRPGHMDLGCCFCLLLCFQPIWPSNA